ncbi:ankyrin repeat-containing domain protein, partial [Lentinula raphanica]
GHAIQLAALKGVKDVIELFIEYGADVNALGEEYSSALQVAAYWGQTAIVEILIKHGADINAKGG